MPLELSTTVFQRLEGSANVFAPLGVLPSVGRRFRRETLREFTGWGGARGTYPQPSLHSVGTHVWVPTLVDGCTHMHICMSPHSHPPSSVWGPLCPRGLTPISCPLRSPGTWSVTHPCPLLWRWVIRDPFTEFPACSFCSWVASCSLHKPSLKAFQTAGACCDPASRGFAPLITAAP